MDTTTTNEACNPRWWKGVKEKATLHVLFVRKCLDMRRGVGELDVILLCIPARVRGGFQCPCLPRLELIKIELDQVVLTTAHEPHASNRPHNNVERSLQHACRWRRSHSRD